MDKKGLLISVGVILIVVTAMSGCITSESVSAYEIKMDALTNFEFIFSYRYDLLIEMETTYDYFGTTTTTMTMDAEGAIDMNERKLYMKLNSIGSQIMEDMDMEFQVYFIDEAIYFKMDFFGSEDWIVMYDTSALGITSDEIWGSYDQMTMEKELLEYSQVERLPDKTVNGKSCYVLKLTPDLEKLLDSLMDQMGLSSGLPQSNSYTSSYTIKNFDITLSIDEDTNFIMEMCESASMEIDIEGYKSSIDLEMTIWLMDHNQEMIFVLPDEAQDAIPWDDYLAGIQDYYYEYDYSPEF